MRFTPKDLDICIRFANQDVVLVCHPRLWMAAGLIAIPYMRLVSCLAC